MEPRLSEWLQNDQVAILTDCFKVFDTEGLPLQNICSFDSNKMQQAAFGFGISSHVSLSRQWQDQQRDAGAHHDVTGVTRYSLPLSGPVLSSCPVDQ